MIVCLNFLSFVGYNNSELSYFQFYFKNLLVKHVFKSTFLITDNTEGTEIICIEDYFMLLNRLGGDLGLFKILFFLF